MDTLAQLSRPPQIDEPPDPEIQLPVDEDFDDFLTLFEDLRGLVPLSFFLLFKIARVLKSPDGKLGGQLKGFYEVCKTSDRTTQIEDEKTTVAGEVPVLNNHNPRFGLRRIRSMEEISFTQPTDVAIEEFTDLLRKAEERELNVRVLLNEDQDTVDKETAPIHDRGTRQMSNAAEQKLYILLDRSYSMWEHMRMLYAKLLAIEFLRRKKRSGARLFFRAFDFVVYDVEKVGCDADYDKLVRKLLYIEPGGKGTDIPLALMTAIEDIKFDGMLEGAEILLISDGNDHINVEEIKEALGEKIKIHMLKIGRDTIEPSETELKEMMAKDHSVRGMTREQIAAQYKKQLMQDWEAVTATLIETDDLDNAEMSVSEEEIQFALDAAEKVLAVRPEGLTTAQIESAFRKASFVEGFLGYLQDRAEQSPIAAARKSDIDDALARLHGFKLRIAAQNQMLANLLASKDLKFVNDKTLRKAAKRGRMTMEDLADLADQQQLLLKIKLGGQGAPSEGTGISLLTLLKMIAKSAGKAMSKWFFSGDDDDEDEGEKEKKASK